ncbi:MAG TPA: lysophospholipid acyltransferase family protein [Vicinamibacterales bacterium]
MAAAWRHALEYRAVAVVAALVRSLPQWASLAVGAAIGHAFYLLDAPHRRLTIANLTAAFPHKSPRQIRTTARRVFAHFGSLLTELLRFSGLSREKMLASVQFEGEERVRQALAGGKGALFITGHFGYWELHAMAHALKFPPISVVARALDNPRLNDWLERLRTSTGNSVIHRRGGLRRILRALSENQGVAILIDQHIQTTEAVMVEFFNRPAATTSAVAALALRTGAPVIPVFAVRLPGGRYRMIYEHPVEPPPPDHPDAIREFTQRCTDVLEMYVRRYPDNWLWMHRRWRDLPSAGDVRGMFPAGAEDD